jgi:hypothetical protein
MMKEFMGAFVLPKFFMLLVRIFQYLFYVCLALMICFTSDNLSSHFKDEPFYVRMTVHSFETLRYNLRIIAGTIIPIDAQAQYKGLSIEELKLMPDKNQAGFKLNPLQHMGIKLMSYQVKILENQLLIVYFGSKEFYNKSKLKNLQINPDINRELASEKF